MSSPQEQKVPGWLAAAWTEALSRVLESLTGVAPLVSWSPGAFTAERPAEAADLLWWEQPLTVAPGTTLWVGTPVEAWREIGGQVLRASGVESDTEADIRSAFFEVLGQSLSGLAQSIGQRLGREINCEGGGEAPPPPMPYASIETEVAQGSAPLPALLLAVGSRLLDALEEPARERQTTEVVPAAAVSAPSHTARTLDLLMEVELPVSVSFGRAELLLKDVLKLTTGSIVELNRTVDEPVELIVNNCVIARGEVVVVEGNYGLRITHIISAQERLRTLK